MSEVGVGVCPKNAGGHVWAGVLASGDARNPCRFCGRPGRDNHFEGETGGFFAEATGQRMAAHVGLKVPMQSGTGDVKKAWPNGMPAGLKVAASLVVADKQRRDREAKT